MSVGFQLSKNKLPAITGLEIESDSIAAAEVRANGSAQVSGTGVAPLPSGVFRDGEVADPVALGDALRDFFSEYKLARHVRLGIANQGVVVRTVRLPAIDDPKEMEAAVRFQAQEQIPMPLEQAVLDHRVVGGVTQSEDTAPQVDVMVVAARRDMISALLETMKRARLQPIGVDLSAFGMIRALGDASAPEPALGPDGVEPDANGGAAPQTATLFCHVGSNTNLAVAKGRSCLFSRVSPAGLDSIVAQLKAEAGLTEEHARMWVNHVGLSTPVESIEGDPGTVASVRRGLEAGASSLVDDLRLSLDYYRAQEGSVDVDRVVICGPGSAIPGVQEWMAATLQLPFHVAYPAALSGLDPALAARLTLSYGLALDN